MKTFYTITDVNTTHTNSRSKRFNTEPQAIEAAYDRLERGGSTEIVILKAIKLVRPARKPVIVEPLED